ENIDTITLYLNPKRQKEYYQKILDLNPRRVIFNPGTENPEFQTVLEEAGVVVEIACTLVLLATNQY
ncbi:MAG: CoA-binding protein, partial [Bacteroidota bacterium]